jgi:hypothetical protein
MIITIQFINSVIFRDSEVDRKVAESFSRGPESGGQLRKVCVCGGWGVGGDRLSKVTSENKIPDIWPNHILIPLHLLKIFGFF